MCEYDDFELEVEENCEHEHISEREFIKSLTYNLKGTMVIIAPHTVKFKCSDCSESVDIFVMVGAFNI